MHRTTKTGQPIFDTIGDLREYLADFPAETPLTETYTGEGRIAAIPSYGVDQQQPECLMVFRVTDAWLAGQNLPLINPRCE